MSKSPKRRAHVWYSLNNKSELVMQDENKNENESEGQEPDLLMTMLCAIGFLAAYYLAISYLLYALEGVLCMLGVISDC